MTKARTPASGHARIAQAEEEEELLKSSEDDDDDEYDPLRASTTLSSPDTRFAPIQPERHERMQASTSSSPATTRKNRPSLRRFRSNSGVDIKAINARLERWADEIASKLRIRRGKGKTQDEEQLEIHHSVFQAPDWIRPATAETLASSESFDAPAGRMTKEEFDSTVESVWIAIEMGIHPKLISQGSSGSYFARDTKGKVVGVFKPKDEEPYASRNPKWTKWIHRNLFPFFFGRACLIPNLSYVSEAAAYVLDARLRTNLVPYTDVVSLSSKSFYYDFWDRRAYYRKKKPLPEKPGSFQIFLKGYKDANLFLKEHPWPDQHNSSLRVDTTSKKRRKRRRRWTQDCGPTAAPSDDEDEDTDLEDIPSDESNRRRVFWTDSLRQAFREQLEKLVILDYIMRNTDRGLDNWMIRVDEHKQEISIVTEPPKDDDGESRAGKQFKNANGHHTPNGDPYRRHERMTASSRSRTPSEPEDTRSIFIGAIDNSLSWPWKHPDAWRSYPFGWLFLPVSLIGQPFSDATRRHFLPLLTSKEWWSETQLQLRRCFAMDADFKERMYARQLAVMKGQAWNVVETLKTPDHGPLELTRRARVCVWDDLVDVPVAVRLRAPSEEMRRRHGMPFMRSGIREEGTDIGADNAAEEEEEEEEDNQQHLLGESRSPSRDPAGPNRFNLSRQPNAQDTHSRQDGGLTLPLSPASLQAMTPTLSSNITKDATSSPTPFSMPHSRSARPNSRRAKSMRLSLDEHRRPLAPPDRGSPERRSSRRRFSFTGRRGSAAGFGLSDDEAEMDLGFAAAEDMEGSRKRVIVERLEMVKSKNPVFTWC